MKIVWESINEGAWGHGPLDNDGASDWKWEFGDDILKRIKHKLKSRDLNDLYYSIGIWEFFKSRLKTQYSFFTEDEIKEMDELTIKATETLLSSEYIEEYRNPEEVKNYLESFLDKQTVQEALSPSGALYGFGGWLSSRDEPVTMSKKHECGIVAELIDKFIKKQELEEPQEHWDDDLIPMMENYISHTEMAKDIVGKIERSRKLPKEIKEKILPLVIKGETEYINGRVRRLKIPKIKGKSFYGVDLGCDKNGFFVMTHRAASKRYKNIENIPKKDIAFIKSTG